MNNEETRTALTQGLYSAMLDELIRQNPDPVFGAECVINAAINMLRNIADTARCPDKDRFVADLMREAASQIENKHKKS